MPDRGVGGNGGINAAMQRQSGFNDVIALFPQMEIIASQNGDFMRSGGEAAMETILSDGRSRRDLCRVGAQ